MHQRRVEALELLQTELNPNAYQIRMLEFGAELADIYSEMYELEVKKPKKSMSSINRVASKCIENSFYFTDIIYKKEDKSEKFEYAQSILNLELSVASKLTKWFTSDPQERIDKTKEALDIYKKLEVYIQEYKEFKGSELEMSDQFQQQVAIVHEMASLLPAKLSKMS